MRSSIDSLRAYSLRGVDRSVEGYRSAVAVGCHAFVRFADLSVTEGAACSVLGGVVNIGEAPCECCSLPPLLLQLAATDAYSLQYRRGGLQHSLERQRMTIKTSFDLLVPNTDR